MFFRAETQREVIERVLLTLKDGRTLPREALVTIVGLSEKLKIKQIPSKCIGRVVDLLYSASCFKVRALLMSQIL